MLTKRKDGRYVKSKTINGQRVYFYSSEPTERKAEKDIENQLIAYNQKQEQGKLLSAVIDEWEEIKEKHVKYKTMVRYRQYADAFKNFYPKEYIKDISVSDIEAYLANMSINKYATKTIKDNFSVINCIFRYAFIEHYIDNDICRYITPPKGKPKVVRQAIKNEDANLITATKDSSTFEKLAFFLVYSGLRRGEIIALTYGDIDYDNNLIDVNKEIEFHNNKPVIGTVKTACSVRKVPLPNILKEIIPKSNHKKTDIIFPNHNNEYMHESYFQRNWNKYVKSIGIKATAHQLRHTYATMLFEWNIPPKVAQVVMGHSDVSITENIYTHIRDDKLKLTTQQINNNTLSKG